MSLSAGGTVPAAVCYEISGFSVPARGHEIASADVAKYAPPVQAILSDASGVAEARESLKELVKTEFNSSVLERVLASPTSHEEWRVGEALAEHHLADEFGYAFPWPDSRSTRNPNSSGGGVDLIGIGCASGIYRFVLCEVKTSHQQQWPPAVATSRSHGLRSQLTGLLEGDDRSRWAIRYMLMNSQGKSWKHDFDAAMQTYLKNPEKLFVIGVLVHVAEPNDQDLGANVRALSKTCPVETQMRLIALYPHDGVLGQIAGAPIEIETAA